MDFGNVTNDFSPITTRLTSRSDRISGLSSLSLPDMMASPFIKKNLFSPGPTTVLSPVTNLALNMNNLAGLGSQQCDTPKRKRVPLLKIPSFASDCSSDAGLGMDSPSPMDPIHVEETFEKAILQSGGAVNEKMPIRRINSLPLQLLDFSPALKGPVQESQDQHFYGDFGRLGPAKDAATSSGHSGHGGQGNKENQEEGFEFKKPSKAMSPCRMRSFHSGGGQNKDDARWPSSAPALMLSPSQRLSSLDDRSPVFLHRCSLDDDDGFLDVLDDCEQCDMPMGMSSLLTAPLVRDGNAAGDDTPVVGCRPRGLFRSPSMPSQVGRVPLKRPQDQNTPVRVKRRRSLAETRATTMDQDDRSPSKMRSKSFCNHTEIEKLLDKELIGDFTKPFVLST
ncbi:unnamed protein product, partial [Coregonus sp. 'balchen']